jgi:Na+-translocating ferredoxin:NAD+ oxidoreductase RnfD subunit
MSAADRVLDTPHQPRAVSTRTRAVSMLLALLPGAAMEAWGFGPAFAARVTGVLLGVFVAGLISRERFSLRDWSPMPLLMALLAFLWLPGSSPWWLGLGGAGLAYGIARVFRQASGASVFHPAMIGAGTALLFAFPSATSPPLNVSLSYAVAGAWIGGGIALAACRCIRWQVVVAVWLGAALAFLAWLLLGGHAPANETVVAALPSTALIQFFIATDPSSGCVSPRARWLFGAGVGLLSQLALFALHDRDRMLLGMAGAVLLMNAVAPWLDSAFSRARHPVNDTSP